MPSSSAGATANQGPGWRASTKAVLTTRYGAPESLRLEEMEKGVAEDNEVLVRVHAASVNALDWRKVRGAPFLVRFVEGLTKPKRPRLGVDFAGVVESRGKGATEFHPGDEVFGIAYGAFAEYVSAAEKEIVLKPANASFEAAAAVPMAALTALQAVRDLGEVRAGHSVLVNGAGGGVGTYAVQIARALGAEVTAVSNTGNLELLRSLGADHVVDYSREDFAKGEQRFDRILDLHPTRSVSAIKRILKPDGICVAIGFGGMLGLIAVVLRSKMASTTHGKRIRFFVAKPNKKDFGVLREFLEAGKLRPVIDRRYTLAEVPAAIRYVEEGHARGKVIIVPASNTGPSPGPWVGAPA